MTQPRSRNQHFLLTALLLIFSAALCYGEVSPREALRQSYLLQDGMNLPTGLPYQQRLILASHMAAGIADADELQSEMQNLLRGAEPTAWLITSDTAYSWSIDQWVPDSRNTYSYGSGKQTVWLSEVWDTDSVKWLNAMKISSTYSSGRLATSTIQMWQSGAWTNMSRISYTYDGLGRIDVMTSQLWIATEYFDDMRTTFTYGTGNRIETAVTERYIGAWENYRKEVYSYDGNSNLTEMLTQNWSGAAWVDLLRTTSTYNGLNQETESVYQLWSGSAWTNQSRNEYTYNGSGELTIDRYSTWVGSAWSPSDVDTLKYSSGKNIETVTYNIGTGFLQRSNYTYDGNDNLILELGTTKTPFTEWENSDRTVFVYESILAVKVDDTPLPGDFALLQNHPNPFNPTTTIRYSLARPQLVHIEVYNILGQLVSTLENSEQGAGVYETTWNGKNANGQEVASGVYFYRLKAGDFVQTRKMVLSR